MYILSNLLTVTHVKIA